MPSSAAKDGVQGGTAYHSAYWAHSLTLRGPSGSIEALSRSIAGARVDLNPHQVDAALFALRSPLSRGVVLADEVGLGKTIEAGLVIAQRWAERRRRILLVVPATLRTQWQQELTSKFFLPTTVLDARLHAQEVEAGRASPLSSGERLIVCSYHFVAARTADIARVPWDLVVLDEAHRLRNVYRPTSRLARAVVDAVGSAPKLLLTATPLQNSLMELYGLASVVDAHLFGDAASFRDRFVRVTDERRRNDELRSRLRAVCIRTLRKQVVEYVPFTRRIPLTQDFRPSDAEHSLYERISAYLQRADLVALPASQRALVTLVLRKLLASSTFAIASTLERLVARLERLETETQLFDDEDLDGVEEFQEEEGEADDTSLGDPERAADAPQRQDPARITAELAELRAFATAAREITANAKGDALAPALQAAFDRASALGAPRKAVVFTESRRTQQYLLDLLNSRGFAGQVVLMNGSNGDPASRAVYESWKERHAGDDVVTGSRPVDVKSAIVEHFRDHATILVATEAAAEGVNLQFCSLVVNFDLPWNPQRIEQRIGRCHRYGQKHDVVVVNFLNRRNEADRRVLELLSEKFRLFDGVFGASDEVLGALESGVDVERRIAAVYQTCRDADSIRAAFDRLQAELDDQIQARMAQTRSALLENFDEEVGARLRVHRDRTLETLSDRERMLLDLTRFEAASDAEFDSQRPRFTYRGPHASHGSYDLDWKEAERSGATFYRQDHPLASALVNAALTRSLPPATVTFDYAGHGSVVSALKPWLGSSGWIDVSRCTVTSVATEESLLLSARTDDGRDLEEELVRKLWMLPATVQEFNGTGRDRPPGDSALDSLRDSLALKRVADVSARNARLLDEEVTKLDRWSDDLKLGLERELKDLDAAIRDARRTALLAVALEQKLAGQREMKALETARSRKRRQLFDAQDAIDRQRDALISRIEAQLQQTQSVEGIFRVRWSL